jgi:hypothetical protein
MTFGARLDGELLEIAPNAARFADVQMEIVGGNAASRLIPQEPLPTRVSYFVGNDRSRWVSGAGTYSSVRYDDVYPGIDVVYHGKTDRLEYDFVVEPRQDPKAIRLAFPTAERLTVDADGSLVITSSTGEMRHHAPHAYQDRDGQRQIVAARFRVEEKSVSFELAGYDRDLELVIDPVLSLSRYLSVGDYDRVRGVEVDSAGNIYVMGTVMLPPSPGLGVANSISQSIYVAKYNSTGTVPIFIAYIGADWMYYDPLRGFAIDPAGNSYIGGTTGGETYPTTPGAFQEFARRFINEEHNFLTKLNASGTALVYSTYVGDGRLEAVAADADGNAYVTGNGGPASTPGTYRQNGTIMVAKFGPTGSLVYSTKLGGTNIYNIGKAIAVDSSGNAIVAGLASTDVFDTTPGALFSTYGSGHATFVAKLNATGTNTIFATRFFGGSLSDLALAADDSIYLLGKNGDDELPITPSGWDITPSAYGDIYVARLNSTGTALIAGSLLGGESIDDPHTIDVGSDGYVVVAGDASSDDFPVVNGFQKELGGYNDWFVTRFTPMLDAVTFSTCLGPGYFAGGTYGAISPANEIVVAGNASGGFWIRNHPTPPAAIESAAALAIINLTGTMPPGGFDSFFNNGGPTTGGFVYARGHGFLPGATLWMDGTALTPTYVDPDGTWASADYNSHPAGSVTLTLKNPGGAQFAAPGQFVITPAPTVSSISPNTGSVDGGTLITIDGANFQPNTRVFFEYYGPCTITEHATNRIKCLTPTITSGASNGGNFAIVLNPDGQNTRTVYTWTAGVSPTIGNLSVTEGPATGGTTVTINGSNFLPGVRVAFGSYWCNNVTRIGTTQLTVVTPPNFAGPADVEVSNPSTYGARLTNGFTYRGIMNVQPFTGEVGGGTAVTLTGRAFAPGDAVFFNGVPATNVVVVNATQITALTPANPAGLVTVTVTGSHEPYTLPRAFFYNEYQPVVSSISPNVGPYSGGTPVTITGQYFLAGAKVTFGNNKTPATDVVVVNSTTITAKTPVQAGGVSKVTVTNYDGQFGEAPFTFNGISFLSPSTGRADTYVRINGQGIQAGSTVTFDGVAATVMFTESTGIEVKAPVHAPGFVTVVVTLPGGSTYVKTNAFRYLLPQHTVTDVSPNSGPQSGGTTVTISGTNFVDGSTVVIGGSAATNVTFVNATTITAKTPALNPGIYTVTIYLPDNQQASKTNAFTSLGAPVISSVAPATGPSTGGTNVTILGSGFVSGATVSFGGSAATAVNVVSPGQVTCTTPAHATGFVDVVVTNPDTQTITRANGFRFLAPGPTITSFTPSTGGTGDLVTINGTNFDGVTQVRFNTQPTTSFTIVNSTQLTVIVPPGASSGPLQVVTASGTATSAATFTVDPRLPEITSFTPTSGGPGVVVTLTGVHFTGATSVKFNGNPATFTVDSDTTITANVPATISDGPIVVITPNGTATSSSPFTVAATPTIASFTPTKGQAGTQVTITGTNYVGVGGVKFNGVSAAFTVVNETTIEATVPGAATTGPISITNVQGTGLSAAYFHLPVVLSSFSPSSGTIGTQVRIAGNNFIQASGVAFNGTPAVFVIDSESQITVTVPADAATGQLTVTTPYGAVNSVLSFTVLGSTTPIVVAAASGPAAITVTWSGDPAHTYQIRRIARKTDNFTNSAITQLTGVNQFVDNGVISGNTYLYNILDITTGVIGNNDYATAMIFTDAALAPGTPIQAAHFNELRTAVNAMRKAAALTAFSWTDPSLANGIVKTSHVTQLRSALNDALLALNRYASFTDSSLTAGMPIRAAHIRELREAVK